MYRSIDFLPMWNFWKIVETNDNKYLVIKPIHSYDSYECDLDLSDIWEKISDDFEDKSGSHKHKKITALKNKLNNRSLMYLEDRTLLALLLLSVQIGVANAGQEACEDAAGKLNDRGYNITNKNKGAYRESVIRAAKRADYNVSFMDGFSRQIKKELAFCEDCNGSGQKESKECVKCNGTGNEDGKPFENPFNSIVASYKKQGYDVGLKTTIGEYLAITKQINASVKT